MSIDDPIKEQTFKSIISVLADTREDALNILKHLESDTVTFDIIPGYGEGESNYDEQLPLTKISLPSGQEINIGTVRK